MKNGSYVKNTLAKCNEDSYLPILNLSRVELRCKLQKKSCILKSSSSYLFKVTMGVSDRCTSKKKVCIVCIQRGFRIH